MAMVKNPFNGNLNSNEIFTSIFNMIISQEVFSDNIKGVYGSLVDKYKVDGTLYGDTKLYYSTDALKSQPWNNDSEASNLLSLDRPADPVCQAVVLDQFRQIRITVDQYLSKRAWSTEGAFGTFQSVVLGWVQETKKIYEATLFNSYVGTVAGGATRNEVEVNLDSAASGDPLYGLTGSEKERMEAMLIAQAIADLFVDMKDISRDFNDYKYLRSYELSDLRVVWNSKFVNKIKKVDIPTIFHNDGLMDKFEDEILPARYFGNISTSSLLDAEVYNASTNPTGAVSKSGSVYTTLGTVGANKIRSLIETDITVSNVSHHLFPGDELPTGATIGASANIAIADTYIEDAGIIAKVVHKKSFPFMSAFEVATEFFNPRSLTSNHYLTWGYSKPDYLRNYPIVSIVKK